jgi:alkylation response protein AidB-like acyl-CoA dehydrogenase
MEFFNESRLLVAAQAVGTAQGAFDRALAYVKQREQFGHKIIDFQITRNKLADMATDIEASRLLTYHGGMQIGAGSKDAALSAMAKMHAARTAVAVCDEAIQLLGGYGYMLEYEVERFFRDAKTAELLEGNKQAQKDVISGAMVARKVK